MPDTIEVVKGGVTWFDFRYTRGKFGLEIWVKVAPEVESFVKGLGSGNVTPLEAYGRNWYSTDKEFPLSVYDINEAPNGYRLNDVNDFLYQDRHGYVNLAFLRLVGISEGPGVTFGVRGPISFKEVSNLKVQIAQACRGLAKDYIVPLDLRLQINSQPGV